MNKPSDNDISHIVQYCVRMIDWDKRMQPAEKMNGWLETARKYFSTISNKTITEKDADEILTRIVAGLREYESYENIDKKTVTRKIANYYSRFA